MVSLKMPIVYMIVDIEVIFSMNFFLRCEKFSADISIKRKSKKNYASEIFSFHFPIQLRIYTAIYSKL